MSGSRPPPGGRDPVVFRDALVPSGVGRLRRRRAQAGGAPSGRRSVGVCVGGAGGDRGRTCVPRTAMSSRSLRSAPSGLEENAVADQKVRSRRRRPDRIGRAQRLRGRGRTGAVGAGGVDGWEERGGSCGLERSGRQSLRERVAPRDSLHAADTGGAVCATVVGIARIQWGSAWSP